MDEEDGFEEFYRTTRQRVVTLLYALGGDLAEAQDAAQEAYVRAWQRWSQLSGYDDRPQGARRAARRHPSRGGRQCLTRSSRPSSRRPSI